MYLPLGSAFIRFLQLRSPLSDFDQTALYPEDPNQQLRHHYTHNPLVDLGILSPYHDAPTVRGVSSELPDDCTIDQVILLHRHGSRGPTMEQKFILQLVSTLDKAHDIIQATDLPPYLQFLKEGYKYQLVPEELTVPGRKELFEHGIQFASRYPTFSTEVVVSTMVPRVIESAHYFSEGFFGLEAQDVTFLTTRNFSDPVPWLSPWESCPKISYEEAFKAGQQWAEIYVPPIADELNELVPGINFTLNDTRGALYACPYDRAAQMKSPWCNVFTADESRDFEYEQDLVMDGMSGHESRGDAGPLVGAFYVKKLIERLTDTTSEAEPLYLEFAHDITILDAMSAMGLNKDDSPLKPTHIPSHRKFKTSYQTPFAASMVWERFTCEYSFDGPQVRLVLNGATFPLSTCEQSEDDRKYGTCSLTEFVQANEYSMSVEYHSAVWNATCERDH